jgi:hypothetical protein
MLFELLMLLFAGGAAAAVIAMIVLSASAVVDQARQWWGSRTSIVVIDPSATAELARIAANNGTKRHKRFVFNKQQNELRLVESDSISSEFINRPAVELYVA